jgi:hypothetical protein
MHRFLAIQSFPAVLTAVLLTSCGGGAAAPPPPPATHFSVSAPAAVTGGTAFNFTVTALDASNKVVTGYSGTVHFTSTDGQAVLPPNSALANGTATLSATLKSSGNQTITGTDTVAASITGTSSSIKIPGATHFSVTAPAAVTGGTAFNFTVTALDAANNSVITYSGTVHFTSTDAQAALPGNSTLTNGTGTLSATFETVGSHTMTATDSLVASMTGVSNSIQVSPASTSGFTATGSLLTPRQSHTATLLIDGRVLVAGGVHRGSDISCPAGNPCMSVLASAELFDPATGVFTSAQDMGDPRVFHTATLLTNGKVLIAGGDDETTTVYATAQLFDPASGLFASTGNMIAVHTGHTATLLADGRVLVAGGGNRAGSDTEGSATAELYDPATGKFTQTGNMNVSRTLHTATLLSDGTVLIAGGYSPELTAELYDPATGTFTLTGSMSISRMGHTATLLTSGEVLVTGGQYGRPATATTELYNPLTRTFTLANPMVSMREGHTATRLADGKVLLTGGVNYHKIYSSAELYDPNGVFTLAGNMETVRFLHAATLLANGEVLITGGNTTNVEASNSLGSAELGAIGTHPGTVSLSPQAIFLFCHLGVGAPPGCSPPWLATLTNSGTTPVYLIGVAISPARDFFQTNDCPPVLAPAQSCTVAVSFDGPGARDQVGTFTYTGTLYVSDTASGSAQKVMLTGTTTVD